MYKQTEKYYNRNNKLIPQATTCGINNCCFSVNKPLVLPVVDKKPWQKKNLRYNVSEGLPDIHNKIKEVFNIK
ncbi:MAG: hypothetical protein IJN68_07155, partial [Clostridia bacterium]|nr:hypothetical protein [Clostridia bacterium]